MAGFGALLSQEVSFGLPEEAERLSDPPFAAGRSVSPCDYPPGRQNDSTGRKTALALILGPTCPARRCSYCVLRVEPGVCATLASDGKSIFLSFSFLSSAAIVPSGSPSQRLMMAASATGIPSFAGYRLEYDFASALQYLISEGVPLAMFCAAAAKGRPNAGPVIRQNFTIFMALH